MDHLPHLVWSYAQGHLALAGTTATLAVAGLVSLIVQLAILKRSVSPADFANQCFPFRHTARSLRTDAVMFVGSKLLRGLLAVGEMALTLVVATGAMLALGGLFPDYRPAPAGLGAIIAWSLLLFVAMEFGFYWTHYFEHHVDFLWEIHKVHHSASALNPLTASRTHPLSDKLRHLVATVVTGLPAGVAMFLYGLDLPETLALMLNADLIAGLLVLEALHHTSLPLSFGPLDRVFVSPRLHQAHHCAHQKHWNRNFGGKLAVWDWLFGTLWRPAADDIRPYGIGRGAAYNARYDSLHGAYIQPVIDAVRVLAGRRPDLPPPEPSVSDVPPPES